MCKFIFHEYRDKKQREYFYCGDNAIGNVESEEERNKIFKYFEEHDDEMVIDKGWNEENKSYMPKSSTYILKLF